MMNIEWVFERVTETSLLGVGIIGSLALWFTSKTNTRASEKTLREFRVSAEATIQQLTARIEEMSSAPVNEPAPVAAPVMTAQGLNLTTRARALRMYRRGETISSISAALGAQQEEVNLLLKLNHLLETPMA